MAWPIVRGVMTLGYAMNLGYRALRFSANVALEDMMQEDSAGTTHSTTAVSAVLPAQSAADSFQVQTSSSSSTSESQRQSREKAATLSNWLAAVNILISLAFFIFMYKYIPLLAATELKKVNPALGGRIVFNLIDGTAAVQKYSTYHPRCGTSFLMTVMLISIGFYMLIPFTTFWARFASRIVLLPVIAGVSYEIIRFAAKHRGSLFALMTAPGLWLQRITTQPPSDDQAQCAIAALDHAMSLEKERGGELVIA
jgi:uncharacterized protein YqhQ